MITYSRKDRPPRIAAAVRRGPDCLRLVSLDVEWQKNYRIKNGNRPFCYSLVWLEVPSVGSTRRLAQVRFGFKSVYLEPNEEPSAIATAVDKDLRDVIRLGDVLVGHQLCSDLAVVQAQSDRPMQWVRATQQRWHARRDSTLGERLVIDTRFDLGHLLEGRSRRLVDVCTELGLDVRQPELGTRSMTALHRDWIDQSSTQARERITVLNLRHSLSAGLLAMYALGGLSWRTNGNVNRLLDRELDGLLDWTESTTFQQLLGSDS